MTDPEPIERTDATPFLREIRGRGGNADYLDVKWRKVLIGRDVEKGVYGKNASLVIDSEIHHLDDAQAIFRATVTIADENGRLVRRAVSHGSETKTDFGDYLEKAETKAIGRALECLGYGAAGAAADPDNGIADAPVERGAVRHTARASSSSARPAAVAPPNPNPVADDGTPLMTQAQRDSVKSLAEHLGLTGADLVKIKRDNGFPDTGTTKDQAADFIAILEMMLADKPANAAPDNDDSANAGGQLPGMPAPQPDWTF